MDMSDDKVSYRNILGTRVACFTWDSAFAFFEKRIESRSFMKQSWLNAHNANIAYETRSFARHWKISSSCPMVLASILQARFFMANAFRPISMAPISFPVFSIT